MATITLTELHTAEVSISESNVGGTAIPRKSHESPAPATLTTLMVEDHSTSATLSNTRAAVVIAQLLGLSLFSSFCNGIIVVGLPTMAAALQLPPDLLVWPTSVFYLTAGSCLLMAGSAADFAGAKRVNLAGSLLGAASSLACGLARSGGELVAFRALQGVANAIIVPSSISIISTNVRAGRPRNLGFACLGLAGPIGFSLGLVLGGVFVDGSGWRSAFYLAGAASVVLSLVGVWVLPRDDREVVSGLSLWRRLASEIDWVGAVLASVGLATLSYFLATLSADLGSIRQASNIALLVLSAASVPAFAWWMRHQTRHSRTALIPNSLWRSSVFTSCCIMVLFTTAATNCMELYSSLFFQGVQGRTALTTSLQILPSLIAGALTNLSTGIFVNRMPVMWSVFISSCISAAAPLLMALVRPEWPYWYDAFFAQILAPLSCDILFTVGILIVSDVFPPHMQALSGAVFNTCAQLGTAIGLTLTSVIATSVTDASPHADKASPIALATGYHAVFWTVFAWMLVVCLVCVLGLRRIGGIGVKRD